MLAEPPERGFVGKYIAGPKEWFVEHNIDVAEVTFPTDRRTVQPLKSLLCSSRHLEILGFEW